MKSFSEFKRARKKTLGYQVESAKQDFMISMHSFMKTKDISKSQLATAIGCSQPYITKILKGDANFTIETMVKISHALNAKLCIQMTQPHESIQWMGVVASKARASVKAPSCFWASEPSEHHRVSQVVANG